MKPEESKLTGRASDKFMLRLPEGMRDKIADAATKNKRSMNAEIVARLERTFSELENPAPNKMILTSNFDALMDDYMRRFLAQQGTKGPPK